MWGYLPSPLSFNTVLKVLASTVTHEKERTFRLERKRSLFADDMTDYVENSKESMKKLLELLSSVRS